MYCRRSAQCCNCTLQCSHRADEAAALELVALKIFQSSKVGAVSIETLPNMLVGIFSTVFETPGAECTATRSMAAVESKATTEVQEC